MTDKNKLFRKAALERLSSPEQLDQLMRVTDPKGWIALSGLGALLLTALVWSFVGEITTTIQGNGILLLEGGLYSLQAPGSGEVEAVYVEEGGWVRESDVVAKIRQPQLTQDTVIARQRLDSLVSQRARTAELAESQLTNTLAALDQDEVQVEAIIEATEERIRVLGRRADAEAQAVERGLLNLAQLERTNDELAAARGALEGARSRLLQISVSRDQAQNDYSAVLNDLSQRIAIAEQDLGVTQGRLDLATTIVSPYEGRVTEVMVDPGQMVPAGTEVLSLELGDRSLEALIFIPTEGRKADPVVDSIMSDDGLQVDTTFRVAHVLPATVRWEEHGYMLGDVVSVSQNPVTRARVQRLLKNQTLTATMVGQGDPYMLRITIRQDPNTATGFEWTSGDGPPQAVTSGVLANANVIVDSKRPIELVIPALRGLLGGS